ncbi:hypothetical protein IFM89_016888 [Coptis chinensis]|uniref:Caffeic acid O-methyltransferase n=1 Tax=Coptis chinensis TaxID=261450 RepID=A0A835I3N9_9MAGN|nr:hypothetical protein IFM89_016888 [Coptis chinensis]
MSSTHNFNHLTPEDEELACLHAMQLTNSSAFPMVLTAAVDLGVLEIIAKAGQDAYISPSDIAAQLPTNNKDASIMLDRMLSLVASHQVLSCTLRTLADGKVERLYGLTPVCKFLVKNEDGVCMAPLVLLNQDKVILESWYHLKNAVLDGGNPFAKAFGMRISEYWGTDSRFTSLFSVKSVVDVGGGTGGAISMIASKHPTIQAINFDLPHVVEIAPKYP